MIEEQELLQIKKHYMEMKQRRARIIAARRLRLKARRERLKKLWAIRRQKRKAVLSKLTKKQKCKIFALRFKCMRKRFHLVKNIMRHKLKGCRRVLKRFRYKLNKKKNL